MRMFPRPVTYSWFALVGVALAWGCGPSQQQQAVWEPDGTRTIRNIKRLEYDTKCEKWTGMYAVQEEKGEITMWWLAGQAGHVSSNGNQLTVKIDVPADQPIWAEKSYYKSSLDAKRTCAKTILHVRSLDDLPK